MLSGLGALVVSFYSVALLFGSCNTNLACTASVYFGMPQTEIKAPEISMAMRDTTIEVSSGKGITASEIHQAVQTVGLIRPFNRSVFFTGSRAKRT